jgi:hypothetical protein
MILLEWQSKSEQFHGPKGSVMNISRSVSSMRIPPFPPFQWQAQTVHIPMNRIMSPSSALLNSNLAPLSLCQETTLGQGLREFLWQNYMTNGKENGGEWPFHVKPGRNSTKPRWRKKTHDSVILVALTDIRFGHQHTFHYIQCGRRSWWLDTECVVGSEKDDKWNTVMWLSFERKNECGEYQRTSRRWKCLML